MGQPVVAARPGHAVDGTHLGERRPAVGVRRGIPATGCLHRLHAGLDAVAVLGVDPESQPSRGDDSHGTHEARGGRLGQVAHGRSQEGLEADHQPLARHRLELIEGRVGDQPEDPEVAPRLRLPRGPAWPGHAAAVSVGGMVLGISSTVVTPPITAAREPLAQSSLWVSPGSRKWT